MQLLSDKELKNYHTFNVNAKAQAIIKAESINDLLTIYSDIKYKDLPKLVLGQGSNVLFKDDFPGIVILNRLLGKSITMDKENFYIDIASGENWHSLVKWSIANGVPGLENLAFIPGCVGSAPIQNIGAYGLEFKDVCDFVSVLDLTTKKVITLSCAQCNFGYRDSIFKHAYKDNFIVIGVRLKLTKAWQPYLSYGPLKEALTAQASPQEVLDTIVAIRKDKLPDPYEYGNAGSFFKNPIVSKEDLLRLQAIDASITGYLTVDGYKISAARLIDLANLKGMELGGAKIHLRQPLVIMNYNQAEAVDIMQLAAKVMATVKRKFKVDLEHEVRCYAAGTEVHIAVDKSGN